LKLCPELLEQLKPQPKPEPAQEAEGSKKKKKDGVFKRFGFMAVHTVQEIQARRI